MSVTISGMRSTSIFAVSNGGTGQTSFTSGSLLVGNGINALGNIPVGTEGQVLTVVSGAWLPANNSGGNGGGNNAQSESAVKIFTANGFSVGQVVALSGSLVAADKSDNLKSNAIGVVSAVSGSSVTVKLIGEADTNGASSYAFVGTPVYVGSNGSVVDYASLSVGDYVTQVGFISDSGKIMIQPRIFGQL